MSEYHKIYNLFNRNKDTGKLIHGDWSRPEFEVLQDIQWVFTEKIDGMNMRVEYENHEIKFFGRTDNALIPQELLIGLNEKFMPQLERMKAAFGPLNITFFGEGYGPKIQKHGELYSDKQDFILFDVLINGTWLDREGVNAIASQFELREVPVIETGTLSRGIQIVRDGFKSPLSGGNRMAEGLIARPPRELNDRRGNRIIAKIKHVDLKT